MKRTTVSGGGPRWRALALALALSAGAGGCAARSPRSATREAFLRRVRSLDANYARAEREVMRRGERALRRLEALQTRLLEQLRVVYRLDALEMLARQLALEPDAKGRTRVDDHLEQLRERYEALEREIERGCVALIALHRRERDAQLALLEAEREHKRAWLRVRLESALRRPFADR